MTCLYLGKSDPGPVMNFRHEIRWNDRFPDEYTLLLEWDKPIHNCEFFLFLSGFRIILLNHVCVTST